MNFLLTFSFTVATFSFTEDSFGALISWAFKLCFEFFSSVSSIELLFKEPFKSVIPSSLKRWFTRFSIILSRRLLTASSSRTASLWSALLESAVDFGSLLTFLSPSLTSTSNTLLGMLLSEEGVIEASDGSKHKSSGDLFSSVLSNPSIVFLFCLTIICTCYVIS